MLKRIPIVFFGGSQRRAPPSLRSKNSASAEEHKRYSIAVRPTSAFPFLLSFPPPFLQRFLFRPTEPPQFDVHPYRFPAILPSSKNSAADHAAWNEHAGNNGMRTAFGSSMAFQLAEKCEIHGSFSASSCLRTAVEGLKPSGGNVFLFFAFLPSSFFGNKSFQSA